MIVVSDTTPIISLLKIGKLHLLGDLFGRVYIPMAVYNELTVDCRFEDEMRQIDGADFILKRDVSKLENVDFLQRVSGLDRGESEAIILSDELRSDILLMDEALGRNVARNMGIKIMGTIGMLKVAYQHSFLTADEIRTCLTLMQTSGRYISDQLYRYLLDSLD